jgi:hypothetical protein
VQMAQSRAMSYNAETMNAPTTRASPRGSAQHHTGNEAATKPAKPDMTLPPPSRKQSNTRQLAPAYAWNGATQELIPILPEDHPDYAKNEETLNEAFLRWSRK